jgi:3-oxoacyl-[acyl-carrier protein] reductase
MTAAMFDLRGRVALVTGASRGLGRHLARTLSNAGAAVALGARDEVGRESLAAELRAAGGRVYAAALDVTEAESVRAFVAGVEEALGPLAIAVNNAGVVEASPWHELGEDEWDRVIDTNLRGVWLVAQEAARCMMRHTGEPRGGSIINIASILGLAAEPGLPAYCASKAGVLNLTRAMAIDCARHGIRVNAIAPGYFETDLNREFLASDEGRAMVRRIPQRRTGELSDLDGPLLLLASDASRFMTGSVLVVDGGHSAAV